MIDPRSIAGVLLREHDTPEQAARYAERKARSFEAMQNAWCIDYHEAAEQLRRLAAEQW